MTNGPQTPPSSTDGSDTNSDIATPAPRDPQEGVEPLTPQQQLQQLLDFFEDHYPELTESLTTDPGRAYLDAGQPVPQELYEQTERMWAQLPDLLTHSSLLVLGAGLDHSMPHVAFTREGLDVRAWSELSDARPLPDGVEGTVITPQGSYAGTGVAIALHGGPGWFGDGACHGQLWLPFFAALARQSGVTVVDLTYPLPASTSPETARRAVEQAFDAVAESFPGADGSPAEVGILAFGSGFTVAQSVLHRARFIAGFSPRIPEGFEADVRGRPVLVSTCSDDTRATPIAEVRAFMDANADDVTEHTVVAEHLLAPPAAWRQRVEQDAAWIREAASR